MTSESFSTIQSALISLANTSSFKDVSNVLRQTRSLYVLNGENIVDIPSFFVEFTKQILDVGRVTNLSNLTDILRDVLLSDQKQKTAFIWTHVDNMLEENLWDLMKLYNLFIDVSRDISIKQKDHINVFFGSGANFPLPSQL